MPSPTKNPPTDFQQRALWHAVTALSMTVIGIIAIGLIYLVTRVIGFLQPILIPFAVAGVLAYLLEPAVVWIEKRGVTRRSAVLLVFAAFTLALAGLGLWLVPKVSEQTSNLASRVPGYAEKTRTAVLTWAKEIEKKYGYTLIPTVPSKDKPPPQTTPPVPSAEPNAAPIQPVPSPTPRIAPDGSTDDIHLPPTTEEIAESSDLDIQYLLSGDWVKTTLPTVLKNAWNFVRSSVGGFLGIFGFLLSFIIVPLYLYYFLIESAHIKNTWSDYLPLRASEFKDEVVSCLTEINRYLIAFFRGQLFVSVINGTATGIGLSIVGLDFGFLIGLALCFLGIIPYLGIVLCWIPAVIIASVQGGSSTMPGLIGADPGWLFPLVVTLIFVAWQQVDGLFITPKVVGESVGLHPMTVIVSVFVWTLLLGGLLGAILAVPMTASVKVLFQRYIWHARIAPHTRGGGKKAETKPPADPTESKKD